ncbi:hypothetical protein DDB_G0274667 [Dictyostelium discoideum AX4]|uniref:Uncharacterized protein n=1 Tax=Dictyostelium discoideum TaxID=44689 RepID=Q555E7_DICDI|nr:hypothetical protein DDB_G0274667 [Dictyostelium discoideum AX4]EAL70226.1 hypothetical protein DDB_G0274667 [Dictyostelium discoideum AX4]|eukprot:XP_644122.1 hypothetical protein DDB_G0274667 [Dictyostelium discoideum AX4]
MISLIYLMIIILKLKKIINIFEKKKKNLLSERQIKKKIENKLLNAYIDKVGACLLVASFFFLLLFFIFHAYPLKN